MDEKETQIPRDGIGDVGLGVEDSLDDGVVMGVSLEFKPIEHPLEPLDKDQPAKCPMPDFSLPGVYVEDGTMWKVPFAENLQKENDKENVDGQHGIAASKKRCRVRDQMEARHTKSPQINIFQVFQQCKGL